MSATEERHSVASERGDGPSGATSHALATAGGVGNSFWPEALRTALGVPARGPEIDIRGIGGPGRLAGWPARGREADREIGPYRPSEAVEMGI